MFYGGMIGYNKIGMDGMIPTKTSQTMPAENAGLLSNKKCMGFKHQPNMDIETSHGSDDLHSCFLFP